MTKFAHIIHHNHIVFQQQKNLEHAALILYRKVSKHTLWSYSIMAENILFTEHIQCLDQIPRKQQRLLHHRHRHPQQVEMIYHTVTV